jgi:hypothetical protein
MGKQKKTRKFAEVKRILNPKEAMCVVGGRHASAASLHRRLFCMAHAPPPPTRALLAYHRPMKKKKVDKDKEVKHV